MEDSLRQAGNKLRVAVQLVEASTGSHWLKRRLACICGRKPSNARLTLKPFSNYRMISFQGFPQSFPFKEFAD
jgi:hypothetical protein